MLTRIEWTREIKSRGQCERCPCTERLHAHHIDEDEANNVLSNGECLCVWCHDDHHGKGGALIAFDGIARNPSEETRRKIGEAAKRRYEDPAAKHRTSVRAKASEACRAARERNVDAQRGVPLPEEHRAKLRGRVPWNKGRTLTEEHRRKVKEAAFQREARKKVEGPALPPDRTGPGLT